MEQTRESWYERKEIQKVTLDWVKINCKLTDRENELLQLIYDRKLIRRDHLEIISESYRNAGVNRTTLLNRAIKKMYKKMCVDKVHESQEIGKGSTPSIVAIDKAGSMILGVAHKKRILHKKTLHKGKWYISRSLPANYRHINGVNQIEVDTILLCEELEIPIVRWEHERGREFHYMGEKILVIPDIFIELEVNKKRLLIYIEFDTGTENHRYKTNFPIIHEKIIKYKKYRASKLWESELPFFPIILLVTEDDKRIQYFNNKCKEAGLKGFGVYHKNYSDFIKHLANMV